MVWVLQTKTSQQEEQEQQFYPLLGPCRCVKVKRPKEEEKMVSPGLPCGRKKIFLFNLKEWGGAEKDCATSA